MPDLDLSAAADAAAQADESAASSAAIDNSAASSAASSDVTSASAASAGAQGGSDAQAAWSLRQELGTLGIDANAHSDDKSAWTAFRSQLAQRYSELQQKAQYGDYYLANQQRIAQALAAHQQQAAVQNAQAQPAQGKEPWWKVPEWDENYSKFLRKDASGNVVAIPGADPGLPLKYQAYQQWQQETYEKLLRDPIGTLKPGLEELIEAKATEIAKRHLGQYGDHELAQRYVHSQPWMFRTDESGQQVINQHTGRPDLSDAGRRFAQYVQYAERTLGIRDIQSQARYAQDQVQLEYLRAQYAQNQTAQAAAANADPAAQAAAANDQLKRDALNRGKGGARRIPNSGALGNNAGAKVRPAGQQDPSIGLEDRLSKAFQDNGIRAVA
jgi:hypothetical protein